MSSAHFQVVYEKGSNKRPLMSKEGVSDDMSDKSFSFESSMDSITPPPSKKAKKAKVIGEVRKAPLYVIKHLDDIF